MKVQLGVGGSATSAATLADLAFSPCADGAYELTSDLPDGETLSGNEVRRVIIDGEHTTAKSGDVRVLLRVKTRCPLSSYNVNGTVVTHVPELQIHTVLTLPKVVVAALQGTLTTNPGAGEQAGTNQAQFASKAVIAEAISILATMLTNQPCNYTKVLMALNSSPWFKGAMGVCPVNYTDDDFGRYRVLPPPARS